MTVTVRTAQTPTLAEILTSLADLGLEVRRSWPRSADQLLLDLHPIGSPDGETLAGQWFRDAERAQSTAAATPGATCSGRIVLQPGGADRILASLTTLLRDPRTDLVSHRPERRAVLRRQPDAATVDARTSDAGTSYTKVVAVKKHRALAEAAGMAAALPLRTPRVQASDPTLGTVTTQALPGRALHELLTGARVEAACAAAGAALAAVHQAPAPPGLAVHTAADEQAVTRKWQHLAAAFVEPAAGTMTDEVDADPVPARRTGPLALIHRDFHDKQVLVAADDSVGVLDFDLMALGDPAVDLANVLVHLDLRCSQGLIGDAGPLRRAVLAGYEPSERTAARVPGYEALARQRLAAVYAFRPTTSVT